jgi:hypothetical protein
MFPEIIRVAIMDAFSCRVPAACPIASVQPQRACPLRQRWYAANEGSIRSKGTMYFVLHPHDEAEAVIARLSQDHGGVVRQRA